MPKGSRQGRLPTYLLACLGALFTAAVATLWQAWDSRGDGEVTRSLPLKRSPATKQPPAREREEAPPAGPLEPTPKGRDRLGESSLNGDTESNAPTPLRVREAGRRVPLSTLLPWSQPGLCSSSTEGSSDATRVRETLTSSFQLWDGGARGRYYVDPRLPAGAHMPILRHLEWAEHEVATRLKLQPSRPDVFVYFDTSALKAAACINEDVVAYYDGALHVVAQHSDVRESVLHEYAHHALMSSGMLGPAWAQEGISMHIARERWWLDPQWLEPVVNSPLSLDEMDRAIPYKLPAERAVSFYVQSAALVVCVVEGRKWGLRELFEALRAGADQAGEAVVYDLPELEQDSFVRGCLEGWRQ